MQYPALRPVGAAAGVLIEKGPNSAVKGSGRTIPLAMERRVYRTISNGTAFIGSGADRRSLQMDFPT